MLEIEDGKHSFRSYLHQRPDEFGTWVLGKNQLIVMGDSGRKTEYKIEEFSSQAIVLIRNSGDKEYYYRDGCVAVEVPTD